DGLRGRQDVRLVERRLQRGAAVAAGAEGDLLVDVVGIGLAGVVGRDQVGNVDEVGRRGRLTCPRVGIAHGAGTSWSLAMTVSPSSTTNPRARSASWS